MMSLRNGESCHRNDIPILPFEEFKSSLLGLFDSGASIAAFFGVPDAGLRRTFGGAENNVDVKKLAPSDSTLLYAVLADEAAGVLHLLSCRVGRSYPSLTPESPQLQLFERELHELCGVVPEGHPWLKPVRDPGGTEFFRLSGGQSHEVAVGPVHAGVIEPGHFRFQCDGEIVVNLEIVLGYQHRGIEAAIRGGSGSPGSSGELGASGGKIPFLVETAAGDTSIGHAIAHAIVWEAFRGIKAPERAWALRTIALELERVANHVGDLGALSGDIGYLPTKSFCGRLRGEFLNLTAELCGNRFGRGLVRPGGVRYDLDGDMAVSIAVRAEELLRQTDEAVDLLWDNPSVLARFEDTGILTSETALTLGLVGPVARACGIAKDDRHDFPVGSLPVSPIPVETSTTGDVLARAKLRQQEYQQSVRFVMETLRNLQPGPVFAEAGYGLEKGNGSITGLPADSFAVGLVEGWRGRICHCALTDSDGGVSMYKIVDPSFHNWFGLAYALRGQQISDFPLCNKSFNLSYCGHDL
jgi:Ni,Fe-hydrogenase III large subunit